MPLKMYNGSHFVELIVNISVTIQGPLDANLRAGEVAFRDNSPQNVGKHT